MNEETTRIIQYNSFIKKYCTNMFSVLAAYSNNDNNFGKWLVDNGFFTAPASTKYHGAYAGGLFDHSFKVTQRLVWMTEKLGLRWDFPDSPIIVGMFHDLCKIDRYEQDPTDETKYTYKTGLLYDGHGMRSAVLLAGHIRLSEEEVACIVYHMGAYEKDMWEGYDTAIRKFPNVLYTHTADMIASKIDGV